MLKLMDLALRPDFLSGPLFISPARRLVKGPAGEVHVEPLIMHVFLLLLDREGDVVTRTELFDQCWGGVMVGDGSLNRAVARVRKIASETAPGLFEIETIPRTGYRLTGDILDYLKKGSAELEASPPESPAVSRRHLVGGGLAAAAVLGGAGLWWANGRRTDPRFAALMERGENALRLDEPASAYFEQAVAIEPRNARAWGLLAFTLGSGRDLGPSAVTPPTAQAAERAARTALGIDPNEPNALLAMTVVQSEMLDRIAREDQYRRILAIDPENSPTMRGLGMMLHGVGRCREALVIAERAIAIDPMCPDHQLRRAGRLWVLGRVADADRVSNRAMELWPSHRLVRLIRLMIYMFTGRTRAAVAMIEDEERNPVFISAAVAPVLRASLLALEKPTASNIAVARKANTEGSKGSSQIASMAILVMSALGELDAAFEVANGFLLDRGSIIVRPRPDTSLPRLANGGWRNTLGLFTPPTKAMRLDPRFRSLADGLGLTDYWRRRGIAPDAFLFKP